LPVTVSTTLAVPAARAAASWICRGYTEQDDVVERKLIAIEKDQERQVCVDCGAPFDHAPQEIAARRGTGLPVSPRCPACRVARREARNARVLAQLRSGDLRTRVPKAAGPDEGAERLHNADCSACRRPIRLPFKPRLDRPVYCRSCLDERRGR
jgi:CxxC-x17-CxxC domain-containing protein